MILIISSSDKWEIINSVKFLSFKKFSGVMLTDLGIEESVEGPTLTKKLLKLVTISLVLSIVTPFIFNWDIFWGSEFFKLMISLIPDHVFFILLLCVSKYSE